MLQLPLPAEGGSIEALASFWNIPSRSDFVLLISWLLAGLRHGGPYPILALSGEQGSAKTVLSKMLRALIDPNVAPVRSAPREERDLFIAASNGHLLCPRQSVGPAGLDLGCPLPARERRQLLQSPAAAPKTVNAEAKLAAPVSKPTSFAKVVTPTPAQTKAPMVVTTRIGALTIRH